MRSGAAAGPRGRHPHHQVSPSAFDLPASRFGLLNTPSSTPPSRIREAAKTHKLVEQELAHAVNATALVLSEAKLSSPEVRGRGSARLPPPRTLTCPLVSSA